MKKTEVVDGVTAGENHAVLSVNGGGGACRVPCAECPWRRENDGNFPAEAFEISANTSKDMADRTFGCHMTGVDRTRTCAGFLLSTGALHNLKVRLAQMRGSLSLDDIEDGGANLHPNYRSMAEANGVDPASPHLEGTL